MTSLSSSAEPTLLAQSQHQKTNWATVAAVVLLLYDYCLTFGREVDLVWGENKMSMGQVLFLLNRYIPILDLIIVVISYTAGRNPTLSVCAAWYNIDNWLALFSVLVVFIMLLLRTWALWNRSRTVLICLSLLLFLCILSAGGATLYGSLTNVPDSLLTCGSTVPDGNVFYAVWISILIWDCVIVVMTLIRTVPTLEFRASTPVLTQLMRDGVLYFIIMFAASIANLVAVHALPAYSMMLYTFYRVVTVALASRLVLNLRMQILRPMGSDDISPKLDKLVFNALRNSSMHDHSSQDLDDVEDPEGASARRRARARDHENQEAGPSGSNRSGSGGHRPRPSDVMIPLMELDRLRDLDDPRPSMNSERDPRLSAERGSDRGGDFDVTMPLMDFSALDRL